MCVGHILALFAGAASGILLFGTAYDRMSTAKWRRRMMDDNVRWEKDNAFIRGLPYDIQPKHCDGTTRIVSDDGRNYAEYDNKTGVLIYDTVRGTSGIVL